MACLEICPAKAIVVKDSIRFYNACIDPDRCLGCNHCHNICPVNAPPALTAPFSWKQGWASDPVLRKSAASGGVASAIETSFVKHGGIVYSCLFQNGKFQFEKAETPEKIRRFAGSKYVKSNPEGIYADIRRFLNNGRKILFVGLPCQSAAVRNFTGGHKNLYLIDLVCHGAPSPKLLDMFLHDRGFALKNTRQISFRKKHKFQLSADGRTVASEGVWDSYTTAFCDGISYTESCYSCRYAQLDRASDLTLGDSWGSRLPASEQKSGVSLILCQSRKGEELLSMAELHLREVDLERAVSYNCQLQRPSLRHKKRNAFFEEVEKSESFQKAAWKCFPIKLLKKSMKAFLLKLK